MLKFFTSLVFTLCLLLLSGYFSHSFAQVRSSTNYQIESDSINVGGGWSSSTSYIQESTVGEVATGESSSASFNLYAGYQQMQEVYLSLSAASDVVMDKVLGGVTGGESTGSTSVVAITDSRSGYQITIEAAASPALRTATTTIADYVPAGAAADLVFTTTSTQSHFAFSPFGDDTAVRFETDGATCGSDGEASSTACWDGLSTSPITIASRTSSNHPSGATTTVYFKVGIGNRVNQAPGAYVATTTLTMLPL